ncbi:MAG: ribosomal protein L7/L12 [Nannocystaceae bacterium]
MSATPLTREEVVEFLSRLTPLEVRALVLELEERWAIERPYHGTTPIDTTMGMPAVDEYVVTLVDPGPQRVAVMKRLREALGCGLVEARALVDGAPSPVLDMAERGRAEALMAALREVGARVELREKVW